MKFNFRKYLNAKAFKKVVPFVSTHRAEFSVGLGIAAGIATVVELVHATVKASRAVDSANCERELNGEEKLSKKEVVALCWRYYILSVLGIAASITGTIIGLKFSLNTNALLVGAYAAATSELSEFKEAAERCLPYESYEELDREKKTVHEERAAVLPQNPGERVWWTERFTGVKIFASYQQLLDLKADIALRLSTGYHGYPNPLKLSKVMEMLGVDPIPEVAYTVGFSNEYQLFDIIEFEALFDKETGEARPCFEFNVNCVIDSRGESFPIGSQMSIN